MADETLTITLDPDLAERVRKQVESGAFANAAEVVRAAVDAFERTPGEAFGGRSADEVRALVEEADRDSTTYTADEVKARLRAHVAELSAALKK